MCSGYHVKFVLAVMVVLGLKIKNISSVNLSGDNEMNKIKKDVILLIHDVRKMGMVGLGSMEGIYLVELLKLA